MSDDPIFCKAMRSYVKLRVARVMLNTSLKISEIKIYLDNDQFRVKVKSNKENK